MSVVNLYNGIYRVLANDDTVLSYLGIGKDAKPIEKAKHIQKRCKPQRIADSVPLITFYAPPGFVDKGNYIVYGTDFVFDIYTKDDVDLAQRIAERVAEIFVGKIYPMKEVENFQSEFVTSHESTVDIENTYCFTVVVNFSVSIEKYYESKGATNHG